MDRGRVRTAQLLLAFIAVAGLVVTDAVTGGTVFTDPYTVKVQLAAGGGLHDRSLVSYRGVQIGEVTGLDLDVQGVEATLALDRDTPVPLDTEAVVSNLSAVGEQYLDLRPRTDHGPFLSDGSTIGAADTRLPRSTHNLLVNMDGLVRRVDVADVRTVSRELDLALGGGQVDLLRTSREAGRTSRCSSGSSRRPCGSSSEARSHCARRSRTPVSFGRSAHTCARSPPR